ncbi:hypothetical protein BZA05DRAFT_405682 [Tricharina praecox]|uniref:uncharacterized protein n=1 Tax=Tricharina praecox TaxID=43433 RepID=UPI00221FC59C|nr:uncharacterized protein BZA05DRAFT_405682 [Tricharina praecox]KAI5846861.1 hypothetical protein BZA05DRAFT_405682 [Tricharina praecox]
MMSEITTATEIAALDQVVVEGDGGSQYLELRDHPGDYGPYPFNPHTAFQRLRPTELDELREEVEEEAVEDTTGNPAAAGFRPLSDHSDEKEVIFESLVGTAEVISVGIVQREPDSPYSSLEHWQSYSQLPTIPQISIDANGNYPQSTRPENPFEAQYEEEDVYDDEQLSPSHRSSLRRLLSRGNSRSSAFGISRNSSRSSTFGLSRNSSRSSTFGISRNSSRSSSSGTGSPSGPSRNSSFRTDSSPQSHLTTPSSLTSRWSFRRSPRQRAADIEEEGYAAQGLSGTAELDSGPETEQFELSSSTGEERLHSLERREVLLKRKPYRQPGPDKKILESLCGLQLCSPQYLGLRKVYIAQVEKKLTTALYHSAIANPNPTMWPQPLAYFADHLRMVTRSLTSEASVTTFVLAHMDHFAGMIRKGSFDPALGAGGTSDDEKANTAVALGCEVDNFSSWHQKIVHEWLLFSLEAWTMLDFSRSIEDRNDLPTSQTFCDSTIADLTRPHLPALNTSHYAVTGGMPATIVPSELTASMLHDWKGIRFKWTDKITDHLQLDSQAKVVQLYANVAYCHLHAIAKENSSLHKAGFTQQHQALVEISDTYRLLFGGDRRSQCYFQELESSNPTDGFFDIFTLPKGDCEPRFLYNVGSDFPVFGDRLLVLKTLLKPNGIRGLWKDKRDSLQWYTFWAVVCLGCFGAIVAVLQLALSAVQAWASVKSLHA